MDGYQTTGARRAREVPGSARTPIIALWPASTRRRTRLAAGMDDYPRNPQPAAFAAALREVGADTTSPVSRTSALIRFTAWRDFNRSDAAGPGFKTTCRVYRRSAASRSLETGP
jgi:CheY-like chemotaxis protein